jgi:hypothetical protein
VAIPIASPNIESRAISVQFMSPSQRRIVLLHSMHRSTMIVAIGRGIGRLAEVVRANYLAGPIIICRYSAASDADGIISMRSVLAGTNQEIRFWCGVCTIREGRSSADACARVESIWLAQWRSFPASP